MHILSTVGTEDAFTPARWLALERECHRLHSLVFVFVSVGFNPLLLVAFGESLRELLEVRVAPLHCTSPVQPGRCSSRDSSCR